MVSLLITLIRERQDKRSKRERFERAIVKELERAIKKVDGKIRWMEKPATRELIPNADPKHIVTIGKRDFYLGERETFHVALPFWTNSYCEIVASISSSAFDKFSDIVELLQEFETKFADMKLSFDCVIGDPKKMAAVLYEELKEIHAKIRVKSEALGIKLVYKTWLQESREEQTAAQKSML